MPESLSAAPPSPECAGSRPELRLLPGRHKRARAGHPWVYSNELRMSAEAKALAPGTIIALKDSAGGDLGAATFNPRPLISARLLSGDPAARIDGAFFARCLRRALALRERLYEAPFYRLAWAEADGLPGLVVDRYGDVCVAQLNTAGMDRLAGALLEGIEEALAPRCVVLKNDTPARALEGLESEILVHGDAPDGPVPVEENGARFLCDPCAGQKTGWFFDHRENRARVAGLAARARTVLDVYAYLGGFGIQAAAAGAAAVTCVDRSGAALDLAARAAALNGVAERCTFRRGEAFRILEEFSAEGHRFGMVVADPPAFVKSRKDLPAGLKGYRKLFRRAAELVESGGFLFAASCSHHLDTAHFANTLRGALRDAGRAGRIVCTGGAGPDHPVHPYLPESAYLKCALVNLD